MLERLIGLSESEIERELEQPNALRLYPSGGQTDADGIEILWAPFDYVNPEAKLAIIGVTPGREQARRSYKAVREAVSKGEDPLASAAHIKAASSFRGRVMEANLKSLLEHSGLAERAHIDDVDQIWTGEAHKIHLTSTIRYPTFIGGTLYNNQIDSLSHPELKRYVECHLAEELSQLSHSAVIVALGSKGPRIVRHAARVAKIDLKRVVELPHPSGSASGAVRDFLSKRRTQSIRPCRCMLCDRTRIPKGWDLSARFAAHDRLHKNVTHRQG